jgi:hypothetical protein
LYLLYTEADFEPRRCKQMLNRPGSSEAFAHTPRKGQTIDQVNRTRFAFVKATLNLCVQNILSIRVGRTVGIGLSVEAFNIGERAHFERRRNHRIANWMSAASFGQTTTVG